MKKLSGNTNSCPLKLVLFCAILKFLSPKRIFADLKRRHDGRVIDSLNHLVRTRYKLNQLRFNIKFLQNCLRSDVAPLSIQKRIRKAKLVHSLSIESTFVRDEIVKTKRQYAFVQCKFNRLYASARRDLSLFDFIRLSSLLSKNDVTQCCNLRNKYDEHLERLRCHRFGRNVFNHKYIINLSKVEFSDIEKDVLSKGVDFRIPPRVVKEEVLAEFELMYESLMRIEPVSNEALMQCKSSLQYISHKMSVTKPDLKSFSMTREHTKALRALRRNDDIVICRPDKGRATVVLDKADYVEKMNTILRDETKFEMIGPVREHDRTFKIEEQLQDYLKALFDKGEISSAVLDHVKPVGSSRPRLYGLPKIHKSNCPLRPILSMSGSPQYSVSRWLCLLLQPVLDLYSKHCVKDTFEFIESFRDASLSTNGYLCSFDVVSLFTNVPLVETIDICAAALYHNSTIERPDLSENAFRQLLHMVTSGVEFSFEDVMYRQSDGVAMGSPLGPVLANIFVGYYESLISSSEYPEFYRRFVDDSLAYFVCQDDVARFKNRLDDLHPALKFTVEYESDSKISFLDVLIERQCDSFVTSVYRKPTFTGMCLPFDAYCPEKYKSGLVKCLVNRAQRICSPSTLQGELDFLRDMFHSNGYPSRITDKYITLSTPVEPPCIDPPTPVYIRLPYLGRHSVTFERRIRSTVYSAFRNVQVRTVYNTPRAFVMRKDPLPTQNKSRIIYSFECRCCDDRYVGRTLSHLCARVRQHVPLHLLSTEEAKTRPKRGRPRKNPVSKTPDKKGTGSVKTPDVRPDTETAVNAPRRSQRLREKATASEVTTSESTPDVTPEEDRTTKKYASAIATHLSMNVQCASVYSDTCFNVLSRGRSKYHLWVLESVYIHTQKPSLCIQKNNIAPLHLYKSTLTTP